MRTVYFLILITLFSSFAAAQSITAQRAFAEGARLANDGEFGKALASYRTAFKSQGDSGEFGVRVRYNLGVCLYRTGELKAAKSEFNTAIRLSGGQHQRAFYALGMTESALENWPAARSAFLASLELAPQDGEAWFDLAFVYLAEHDYDKAAAAFRKSIDNRSVDSAVGHNNLGVIMAVNGEFDAAEGEFNKALTLTRGRLKEARENLAFCRARRTVGHARSAVSQLVFGKRI